ncbi:hypothetical protein PSHT_08785 [Puccinia striiformis]|uniref:Uncharacterized protein n=1 Tax=Puccinia striiformis TaxID=27350 RepID=A0A2S4VLI5_9BASI|nr:hypothetical protein PSHT_08785 [Puccinia striiformis]
MSQYLDSWHEIHILRVKVVFGWTHLLSILAVEQDTDPIWGTRYKHRQLVSCFANSSTPPTHQAINCSSINGQPGTRYNV